MIILHLIIIISCYYRYEEALDEYDKILEKHPNYAPVLKRKVSILKAQGKLVEAIKELNQFLLV